MEPPPPLSNSGTKLRLMCSYNGHILPRRHTKSLCYAGGDTRIVAVDRRATASLSSLTAQLSQTLQLPYQFSLKYQLPHHDLDSLISLTTDDDLLNMFEEYDNLSSSPTPSRIRLFLFPSKPDSPGSVLHDPKSESWFLDALNSSTKVMQKGNSSDSGFGNSDPFPAENLVGFGGSGGLDSCSVPESVLLETNSSFGSTSSSVSVSNLAAMRINVEEGGVNLQDKKVHLPMLDSIESDNVAASAISHPQTSVHQDPVANVPLVDNWDSSKPVGSEGNVSDSSGIQIHKAVPVSGFPSSLQMDQQQQQLQFVPAASHYIAHYPAGPMPVSSYYPIYQQQVQQQQTFYQSNRPYPVYLLPVRPPQPYNISMQGSLIDTASIASGQSPIHLNATMIPSQVVYKEVTTTPPMPDLATKVTGTAPVVSPLAHVPSNENQKQFVSIPQMHQQSMAISSMETANYSAFEDDPAHSQIYKSQPPAPMLPSQYQTMTNATKTLLSEALTQSQADSIKQQIRTSQSK